MDSKILIIDDEPELREILTFDLEAAGYDVLTAGDAREGLEQLKSSDIKIIVSDVRMPRGDGKELLLKLRDRIAAEQLVFIFITGYSDLPLDEGYDLGAQAFLFKPFSRRTLVDAVKRLYEKPNERWHNVPDLKGVRVVEFNQTYNSSSNLAGELSIGSGGVFVASTSVFPAIDQMMKFKFSFADEAAAPISGYGKVRWVRSQPDGNAFKTGFGLEFLYLESESFKSFASLQKKENLISFIPRS